MTVIYVDTLFLLNVVVDYLLLLCSAKVAGEVFHRPRFALSAVLGGCYAVALFLPGFGFLAHPLCRLAVGTLMVLLAFSGTRRLLRQILIFAAISCAFGGGVLAVGMLGGRGLSLDNGVLYSVMDLKLVLLSASGCYAILTLLFRGRGRRTIQHGELAAIRLRVEDREISLISLADTGNTLIDPVSGRQALVADWERMLPLFPPTTRPTAADVSNPVDGVARLSRLWPGRLRLLPYRAIGVESGLLLALRVDAAEYDGRQERDALVALSPTPVSARGGYQVLTGVE